MKNEKDMEEGPKDIIVLGAIKHGIKRFEKIQETTQIEDKDLSKILEVLENRDLIKVIERKGWLGNKIEMNVTEKGSKEVDERVYELQTKWNEISQIYKTGDKEKMKQCMNENKSFLPTMMFFGIMDMMMFSMMFSMMGMAMSDYVPAESIPGDGDAGTDNGSMDGSMDDGGFDFDIGF